MSGPTPFTRRQLLVSACATFTLPAWAGLHPVALNLRAQQPDIAVLVPTQARHPQAVTDYMAGLLLSLKSNGLRDDGVRVLPYRGQAQAAARLMGQLVQQARPQVITGLLPTDSGYLAATDLLRANVPLLVCDAGADQLADQALPALVAGQSLELSQTAAAMGRWAATHLGQRAVLSVGWLESGHDFPNAFRAAFEAQGGTVHDIHVGGSPMQDTEFAGLAHSVTRHRPDLVVALYSGKQAQRWQAAWDAAGLGRAAQVVTMNPTQQPETESGGLTAGSWLDPHGRCDRFQAGCRSASFGRSPFAMLGFEAGERVTALLQAGSGQEAAWSQTTEGPRGTRLHGGHPLACAGQSWLTQGGACVAALPPLNATVGQTPLLSANGTPIAASGWVNSYLLN